MLGRMLGGKLHCPLRIFIGRYDLAIAHVHDAVAVGGSFGVVGDHQHGLSKVLIGLAQHVEDDAGTLSVEITGRFIRQHNCRPIDQRTGESDPLLFTAGKFVGAMVEALGDAEHLRYLLQERRVGNAFPSDVDCNLDIRASAKGRQEIELLKDESDLAFA